MQLLSHGAGTGSNKWIPYALRFSRGYSQLKLYVKLFKTVVLHMLPLKKSTGFSLKENYLRIVLVQEYATTEIFGRDKFYCSPA